MILKPKSTTQNPKALLYKRFIGLEKSVSLAIIYKTTSDTKYWTFDNENLIFVELENDLIPTNASIREIEDLTTILQYQTTYFIYTGVEWQTSTTLPARVTLLSASYNNMAKYQTNKYYYVGSFDYMIKGSIEGTTTQIIKGNIIPLTSLNIKHFNDNINLSVDDLVVINKHLYSVENPETIQKRQPKAFNVYFATLNGIL